MADRTAIEWADATFNPWIGCTRISPACDHCYAAVSTPARTLGIAWGAGQARRRTSPANWKLPLRWDREHDAFFAQHGRRRRVFCASLADVFDNEVDPLWRRDLFELILNTPNLDWLLLTKRIGNAARLIEEQRLRYARYFDEWAFSETWLKGTPPANVWVGATICNQDEADRDIPKLLALPARVRFLSIEPLLGPVNLGLLQYGTAADRQFPGGLCLTTRRRAIDWVIVGGESGNGARPMHPDWVRSLRDQCAAAGVPFLFKQWGEFDLSYDRDRDDPDFRSCGDQARLPGRWVNLCGGHGFHGDRVHYARRVGKKAAGRLLDGLEHNGFPGAA